MTNQPTRFYSLDVLRGFAALSVVLWHWQHFFFNDTIPQAYAIEQQPLYSILFLFYKKGGFAVELFFCLSGFIFFWLYSKGIRDNSIRARKFVVLRFSRLYPLHFLTLLLVLVQQTLYRRLSGGYFVYSDNDAFHFALNIPLLCSWGFQHGASFNGPAWSISVEVFLYTVFFVFCRTLPLRNACLILAAFAGLVVEKYLYPPMGLGILCFFVGGIAFYMYRKIVESDTIAVFLPLSLAVCGVSWTGTAAVVIQKTDFLPAPILTAFSKNEMLWASLFLFPVTIIALALLETRRGTLGRRFSFIGDISYSSYLLHFPLQILYITVTSLLVIQRSIYYSGYLMSTFFLTLFLISILTYHYIEMPAQRYLRKVLKT